MARQGKMRGWMAAASALGFLCALVGTAVGASADTSPAIGVALNGQPLSFSAAPVIIGNHVYVPVRDIAQALGLSVTWDASTDTVELGGAAAGTGAPTGVGGTAAGVGGGSFSYQGLTYAATGLVARTDPTAAAGSGVYWIVEYSITNDSTAPVDVPTAQPTLGLFGPGGVQLSADTNLSGPAPGTVNPGITFSSYDVFQVPADAEPAAYSLGFDTYQVAGGQFTTTPMSAALPQNTSTVFSTNIGATYALQNLWNSAVQKLTIASVTQTTSIVPSVTASSFDPNTTFWIVDFDVANPGPGDITFNQGAFALEFNDSLSIAPTALPSGLPGYVPATSLSASGGILVPAGQTFSGALLFALPVGTPTANPGLSLTVNGQTRIVSLSPCTAGVCPAVQG